MSGPRPPLRLLRGHHIQEPIVDKAIACPARKGGLTKRATCHTLPHCLATHLLEASCHIRRMQGLLGDNDVSRTMFYNHILNRGGRGVRSPVDVL